MNKIINWGVLSLDLTPNSQDHPTEKCMVLVRRINFHILGVKGLKLLTLTDVNSVQLCFCAVSENIHIHPKENHWRFHGEGVFTIKINPRHPKEILKLKVELLEGWVGVFGSYLF